MDFQRADKLATDGLSTQDNATFIQRNRYMWPDFGIIPCLDGTPAKCLDNQECDLVTKSCVGCSPYDEIECKCGAMQHCKTCQPSFFRGLLGLPTDMFVLQCDSCLDGYFLTERGQCIACPTSEKQEIDIERGYVGVFQGCKCGSELHCRNCNPNGAGCNECELGYYMAASSCLPCPEHCTLCNNEHDCILCNDGRSLVNGECNEDCADPFCENCIENKCHACGDHYRLVNNRCERCGDKFCVECAEDGTDRCFQCKAGFKLQNHKCVRCEIDNCVYCPVSITECKQCKLGYELLGDKCYLGIIEHCMFYNELICMKCQQGYRLSLPASGLNTLFLPDVNKFAEVMKCVPCERNCIECDEFECKKCEKGFYLHWGQCKPCIQNCLRCTDGNTCRTCLNGQNDDGTCKECPKSGCLCQIAAMSREIRGIPDSFDVIRTSTRLYIAEGCASCAFDFLPAGCAKCIPGKHKGTIGECMWNRPPKSGTSASRRFEQFKIAQIVIAVFVVLGLSSVIALCIVYKRHEKHKATNVGKSQREVSKSQLPGLETSTMQDEVMVFDNNYIREGEEREACSSRTVRFNLIPKADPELEFQTK